jgi:hypothetical protein
MHREKEFGLNNRKSLYSPLQPKPPFLQIDRPLTSDKDPLASKYRSTVSPFWFLDIELIFGFVQTKLS